MPTMKPTQVAQLVTELQQDPEGLGYQGSGEYLGDLAISRMMNEPRPTGATVYVPVATEAVIGLLIDLGKLRAIIEAARATNADAKYLIEALSNPHLASIDPDEQEIKNAFVALVPAVLTVDNATALRALAAEPEMGPSRAEVLFGWGVCSMNIRQALEAM
ncbi:MAG TPA: hypothetical protein VM223_16210 [Planctomycetota bacterium]|nr:hypothetical protein [Planctomycetota bacterium]